MSVTSQGTETDECGLRKTNKLLKKIIVMDDTLYSQAEWLQLPCKGGSQEGPESRKTAYFIPESRQTAKKN